MSFDIKNAMKSALRLTQSGRLSEATAQIRRTLAGQGGTPTAPRERHPLGETVKALSGLNKRKQEMRKSATESAADLGEFQTNQFTCDAGAREYKLYLPLNQLKTLRPLLIMLHGCTQNADDFAAGTRMNQLAERFGLFVVYPNQTKRANQSNCWNWFNPSDQHRGAGEPSIIAGITHEVVKLHQIDPSRIFIAGLSAGGAMAMAMGASYPELYAAIGVHSGLPYKSASDVMSAFGAMRGGAAIIAPQPEVRTIIFHGDADKTVHPINADKIAEAMTKPGKTTKVSGKAPVQGGRAYTRTVTQNKQGTVAVEKWMIDGAGHAWSGGSTDGSYTDPKGPDASTEMLRFFLTDQIV